MTDYIIITLLAAIWFQNTRASRRLSDYTMLKINGMIKAVRKWRK